MTTPQPLTHLSQLISISEEQYPTHRLFRSYDGYERTWTHYTGERVAEMCRAAGQGFAYLGLQPGEAIGIYSPNRMEALCTELGLFAMRGVSVPFYSTSSPGQVHFIACDANIKTIFVGEQYQYNNAFQVQREWGQIERIIIYDRHVVRQFDDHTSIYYDEFVRLGDSMASETALKIRMSEVQTSDLGVLIYTSGTTGNPKGVEVLHSAMAAQIVMHHKMYPDLNEKDLSINFLPLSHIFEKMWVYVCMAIGVRTAIISDPRTIQERLPEVKPTLMCNVPRFWEKVYQGVEAQIGKSPCFVQRLYRRAINRGTKYRLEYWNKYRRAPLWLSIENWLWQHTAVWFLRCRLGLQRGRFFPTAGAKISDEVNQFLQSVGLPIIVGYGLTESCATVAAYPQRGFDLASIGQVFPHVSVRIDPETKEIQLQGPIITPGYYKNEEANREAFTEDGWFRTGDAGELRDGNLYFIERIKDIFKTANGKYIAPQQIENILLQDPLVEQVAVVADGYKFVSALIYPSWEQLEEKIRSLGEDPEALSREEMCNHPELIAFVMGRIEERQVWLSGFEKVKCITLITEPFSQEKGELTPTLKLKRKAIYTRYKDEIEAMYQE